MLSNVSKLFLLPGLGADERLFRHQLDLLDYVVVPEWIPFEKGEDLGSYCRRFAESLDIGKQDFVGGMSFGGQVALEMAKHLECSGCLLISANRRSSEISAQFRLQNKILQSMPESFVRTGLKAIGIPKLVSTEKLCDTEKEILADMVDSMDFDFFRWSSNAAALWSYQFDSKDFQVPIHQIHGELDSIIQISEPAEVDIIKGAGHLINFTHASELNRWIQDKVQN